VIKIDKKTNGHYARKAHCLNTIYKTIQSKPVKKELLYYFGLSEFGFSKKIIDEMLVTLIEADLIRESESGVLSVL